MGRIKINLKIRAAKIGKYGLADLPALFLPSPKKCCLVVVYNLFIRLYFLAARVAALWNRKARAWIRGRKGLFEELERKIPAGDPIIWVHCSSAGEFEQGKPLIEQLKKEYPSYKILVSFFSPSGYKAAATYTNADVITYLPLDTRQQENKGG